MDAKQIASLVKPRHPVFQSFNAFEAGDHLKYRYTVNPTLVLEGPEELPKYDVNAEDLDPTETNPGQSSWDMVIRVNVTDTTGKHRLDWVFIHIPMGS